MKLFIGSLLTLMLLAAPAYAGNPLGASATLTPGSAGSKATLALKLRYDMQCGQPGPGSVVVQLPARMHPMSSLAVRLNAKTIIGARVSGTTVTIPLPTHKGISCMVIGPGVLTLSLAGVRNPGNPGTYVIQAHVRAMDFTANVAVRA